VGFGAGAEEELFRGYRDDDKRPAERLDLFDLGTFATLHRVGLRRASSSLLSTMRAARLAMRSLPSDLAARRLDFLTWIASRSAWYAYTRAWFLDYGKKGPARSREAAFLSVDTAAFAAVDAGLSTVYLQHGMLSTSLLFPDFDDIIALTQDEAAYLQRRLQNSNVVLRGSRLPQAGRPSHQGPVLFASTYCDDEDFDKTVPFLRWAAQTGCRVICRPHPRENPVRWQRPDVCALVELQSSERSFLDHLSEIRPRIVVSSFSTALIDALHAGIIPVTICADNDPTSPTWSTHYLRDACAGLRISSLLSAYCTMMRDTSKLCAICGLKTKKQVNNVKVTSLRSARDSEPQAIWHRESYRPDKRDALCVSQLSSGLVALDFLQTGHVRAQIALRRCQRQRLRSRQFRYPATRWHLHQSSNLCGARRISSAYDLAR